MMVKILPILLCHSLLIQCCHIPLLFPENSKLGIKSFKSQTRVLRKRYAIGKLCDLFLTDKPI